MEYSFKHFKTLSDLQKEAIVKIWNQEYSDQLAYDSIASFDQWMAKIDDLNHLVVLDIQKNIIAWAADFMRDKERWFSILIERNSQGKGLGREILNHLKFRNTSLNGWAVDHSKDVKSDGSLYPSPIGFYEKNDFKVLSDIRFEKPHMSAVKIRWSQLN